MRRIGLAFHYTNDLNSITSTYNNSLKNSKNLND